MKKLITALLALVATATAAFGHSAVPIGPNGGRLVPLGEGNSLNAEIVLKDGKFVIGLYDEKTKKEIPVTKETLALTHKEKKAKLSPELKDGKWTVAKPEGDDFWLIMQFKETAEAKAKNARLHYDAGICSGCKKGEWLCSCKDEEEEKKDEKKDDSAKPASPKKGDIGF